MNTDTPASPSTRPSPTANPNSKAGAGYGKPIGGNKGNTTNPNASAGAGYGRAVGSERPSMLGSKPTPSPAFTETPPSPALVKPPTTSPTNAPRTFIGKPKIVEQVSVPATIKSPTTNPKASAGAGYGRRVGSDRPSMLGNKKDVLDSVRKKKPKSR